MAILLGATLLALYVAFFAHYDSSLLRVVTILIIVLGVAFNAWLIHRFHPEQRPRERAG